MSPATPLPKSTNLGFQEQSPDNATCAIKPLLLLEPQGGPCGQHNPPDAEDVLSTGHQVARQQVIRCPLGEPVRQTGACGLIKGLPAQIGQTGPTHYLRLC